MGQRIKTKSITYQFFFFTPTQYKKKTGISVYMHASVFLFLLTVKEIDFLMAKLNPILELRKFKTFFLMKLVVTVYDYQVSGEIENIPESSAACTCTIKIHKQKKPVGT